MVSLTRGELSFGAGLNLDFSECEMEERKNGENTVRSCSCSYCRPVIPTDVISQVDNDTATDRLPYLVKVTEQGDLCITVEEVQEKLKKLSSYGEASFRFLSVIGARNSGKTALLNQIMGARISPKASFPSMLQPDESEGILISCDDPLVVGQDQGHKTEHETLYFLDMISSGKDSTVSAKLVNFCIRMSSSLVIIFGDEEIDDFILNDLHGVFDQRIFQLPLHRRVTLIHKDVICLENGTAKLQPNVEWSGDTPPPGGPWGKVLEDFSKCLKPLYLNFTVVIPTEKFLGIDPLTKTFSYSTPLEDPALSNLEDSSSIEEVIQILIKNVKDVNRGFAKRVATETDVMYHGLLDSHVHSIHQIVTDTFKKSFSNQFNKIYPNVAPFGPITPDELEQLLTKVCSSCSAIAEKSSYGYGAKTAVIKYILDKEIAEKKYDYAKSVNDKQLQIQKYYTFYSTVTQYLDTFRLFVFEGDTFATAVSKMPTFVSQVADAFKKFTGSCSLDESFHKLATKFDDTFQELHAILQYWRNQLDDTLNTKLCISDEEVKDVWYRLKQTTEVSKIGNQKIEREFKKVLQSLIIWMFRNFENENRVRRTFETLLVARTKESCLEEYRTGMETATRDYYFSTENFSKLQENMVRNVLRTFIPEDDKFRTCYLWSLEVKSLETTMKELFVGYARNNAVKCHKFEKNRCRAVMESVRTFSDYMESNAGGNVQAKIFDAKHAAYLKFEEITEANGSKNMFEVRLWRSDLDEELAKLETSDEFFHKSLQASYVNSSQQTVARDAMNYPTVRDNSELICYGPISSSSALATAVTGDGDTVGQTDHYLNLVPGHGVSKNTFSGYNPGTDTMRESQVKAREDSKRNDETDIVEKRSKLNDAVEKLAGKINSTDNLPEVKRNYISAQIEEARKLLHASHVAPSKLESTIRILEMVSDNYF